SPSPGKASLNLLKMLANGLQVAVRAGIVRARKADTPTREDAVAVRLADGTARSVAVEVIPIRSGAGGFWVLFEEPGAQRTVSRRTKGRAAPDKARTKSPEQVARLSKELTD